MRFGHVEGTRKGVRNHVAARGGPDRCSPSRSLPHGSSHLTPRGVESVEPMEIGQLVEFEINGETRLQIKPL